MPANQHAAVALQRLKESLGDRAELLDYLPFDKVKFQDQGEIPLATPKAMLFGTLKCKGPIDQKPLVWIYLCRKSPSLVFHGYYPDGLPHGVMFNDEVISKTAPHEAFKLAIDPMRLLVLATYYFIREDVEVSYDITMSKAYEAVIRSICEDSHSYKHGLSSVARLSLIVKLPVCIPSDNNRVEPMNDKPDAAKSSTSSDSDSGVEEMDCRAKDKAPIPTTDVARIVSDQVGEELAKSKSRVDRYLSLDDDVERRQQDLEDHNRQIDALTERRNMLQKELDEEQIKATTVLKQCDRSEAEMTRLWDDMTKEDVWELGQRGARNKRQKID